jgi:hypothetical protein
VTIVLGAALAAGLAAQAPATMPANDLHKVRGMMRDAYDTVRKHYYDPTFRGLDWDARFREYDEKLRTAPTMNAGLTLVAAFLGGLNDSHTTFQPPPTTRLGLRDPAGAERTVVVDTVVTRGRAVRNLTGAGAGMELQELERELEDAVRRGRPRYVERHDVFIWKLPHFVVENGEIDRMFGLARGRRALVLDLRGNPGGLINALNRAIANVFPADVTFATRAGRRGRDELTARGRGDAAFTGTLVILVDSASASSAEIFARTVQLRKRGLVIGDRTAGAVMEARVHPFARGEPIALLYQFLVTDADIVMPDGKSLEGAGVVPDELLLPTAADLAAGRDPALARAAALAGLDLDAAAAGQLFPVEWK